jgi:DNA repair protein RecN (Recombination protein N)
MLTTLRIKNLALVADLTLELQPGYNVITGETGAGKSIIIGALSLVLGERADRTLLRSGTDTCSVEAMFDVSRLKAPLKSFLEENGLEPCEEQQLVLKRTFSASGTNRQFINGSPTTLATLAAVGEWLVDIHGPHEHQSLLNPGKQLRILDAFGNLESERDAFGELVRRRTSFEAEKATLIIDEKTYAQQLDLLQFQVNEISSARLLPGEEEQIEADYKRASNAAKLLELSQAALGVLSDDDSSLLIQAGALGRTLQELQRVDSSAAPLLTVHEQASVALRELQTELSRYSDKVEVDPAQLQQLEERLNLIHSLKRKYGTTLAEVIAFGDEARRKLQSLEQRDAELARLNGELQKIEAELWRAGNALSTKRRKLIPQLSKAVSKQLSDLGFKQSRFDASLTSISENDSGKSLSPIPPSGIRNPQSPIHPPSSIIRNAPTSPNASASSSAPFTSTGLDTIEFQFAPNPGEPAHPLRAIASSGELARVMLALKTVLAAEDQIPVLVFDEVDANVGGETANAVGEKMRQISRNRQVLCITHLPQVAATASAHYVASKQVKADRTISEIVLLSEKERVTELARMLGGQSDAARKHAEALLR